MQHFVRVNYTFQSTVLVITGCLIKIEAIGSEYSNLVQVPLCMECRGTKTVSYVPLAVQMTTRRLRTT
jgi:hypothetical protein